MLTTAVLFSTTLALSRWWLRTNSRSASCCRIGRDSHSFAPWIEGAGQRTDARRLAGVLMLEAEKMVYITPQSGARVTARDPIRVLTGLGAPAPKPAGRTLR